MHVTLRGRRGMPPFRERALFRVMRERISAANRRSDSFRIVEFSIQSDHVHLIVEAHDNRALSRGVQGLAIRLARGVNGALRTSGGVWDDRFHSRELKTPRAVRNAIVYVLMNAKKHRALRAGGIDALSSAPWFDGFAQALEAPSYDPVTRAARTWLARIGWRRHGLVRTDEQPRAPN